MEIIFGIGIAAFCAFSALVLPWINRSRINALREENRYLQEITNRLSGLLMEPRAATPPRLPWDKRPLPKEVEIAVTPEEKPEAPEDEAAPEAILARQIHEATRKKAAKPKSSVSFEQQFGAKLPVWIGGIALALAGFFLVKYSIENNLIGPEMRVILGGTLGVVLLQVANRIRQKPDFANGVRIAQSLSGAGIAILYVAVYAAGSLYALIPNWLCFIGMGGVTALAVGLSLLHGAPIALLGLVGGFLTPALVGSHDPSTPLLFLYLYFVFSGLMIVIKRRNWWVLSVPTLIGAFLWVMAWTFGRDFVPSDGIWLGLFLLAVSGTLVVSSRRRFEEEAAGIGDVFTLTSALNYVGLGGATMLMGLIASKAGFGFMEWGLFGLLAVGGIGLAWFNDRLYGFVPWLAMAVSAVMLFVWHTPDSNAFSLTLGIFAAIYMMAGYGLMWRARWPLAWGGLAAATALGYYLLAYYKLEHVIKVDGLPLFWGFAALALAGAAVHAVQEIRTRFAAHPYLDSLLAVFAATATAFISIGLTIELKAEFLSVAFAAEVLALAWINHRIPIKALRPLCLVLALVFGFLLIPQIVLLVQLTAYSLVEAKLYIQQSIPIVQWPLFQLGVPAAMFLGAAYLLRQERDGRLVRALELAAVALVAVMGYYLTRHAFHVDADVLFVKAGFFERGVITNILFVYGLGCFWVGRRFDRTAFSWSGIVLCGVALFRITYFDLLLHNSLWASQQIGGGIIINSLLIPYGIPLLWTWLAGQELVHLNRESWAKHSRVFMLVLLFTLVSLNVRHIFHGEYLSAGATTNAEIYTYSAVWLLLGIALLFAGALRQNQMIRCASLAMMLLTVGKVFLYDASELEGLYRVFSFLGLGLSLIGLSWFYTRFVFGEERLIQERQDG